MDEKTLEKPNYYAIIPANVRYDDRLRANEKLIYGEISALANKDGKCWASNAYFSKIYQVGTPTISTWINNLAKNGYVVLTYVHGENTNDIKKREITLSNVLTNVNRGIHKNEIGIHKKIRGYSQNRKENNTSINNKKEKEDGLKKIIDFYEENITLMTPFVMEEINQYLENDDLDSELIIEVMKEAVSRNKRNWKYIKTILNNCANNQILTSNQFKISQEEFKSNQNKPKTETKEKIDEIEYKELNITEEEYFKKVRGETYV